jgi:hypothetical protein
LPRRFFSDESRVQNIFPEHADIVAKLNWVEIGDQGVMDSRVEKAVSRLFGHFVVLVSEG